MQNVELEDIELLKIAHHGPDTSTTEAFLDFISPEIAIISAGNKNNILDKIIINRLNEAHRNIDLYISRDSGSIYVTDEEETIAEMLNTKVDSVQH
jgi:beta-lactamase superfamily II metal-dependent hydrolase